MTTRIDRIRMLLKGIETGDPAAVSVISPTQYIQHNPQTQTGREGLAALFARLSKTSPRVNVVRAFADGDFVFGHTEYDFDTRRIGFEVFRFEDDLTVEHWDNIQPRGGRAARGMEARQRQVLSAATASAHPRGSVLPSRRREPDPSEPEPDQNQTRSRSVQPWRRS